MMAILVEAESRFRHREAQAGIVVPPQGSRNQEMLESECIVELSPFACL
jgi:hypothetical protein